MNAFSRTAMCLGVALALFTTIHANESTQGLVVTDYAPPPPTFQQLYEEVPVVVRGVLGRRTVRGRDTERPTVDTDHVLNLLEVLKDDGTVGGSEAIEISEPGGTTQVRGREFSAPLGPLARLPVSQEVIVFLKHSKKSGRYVVAYGPAGLFVVGTVGVSVPAAVRHYQQFGNRSHIGADELRKVVQSAHAKKKQ
jgi:hypothetical protein